MRSNAERTKEKSPCNQGIFCAKTSIQNFSLCKHISHKTSRIVATNHLKEFSTTSKSSVPYDILRMFSREYQGQVAILLVAITAQLCTGTCVYVCYCLSFFNFM